MTNQTTYGSLTAVTATGFDDRGRAVSRTDALGNRVFYEIVIGDYNRNEWTYVYDSCRKKWMLDN